MRIYAELDRVCRDQFKIVEETLKEMDDQIKKHDKETNDKIKQLDKEIKDLNFFVNELYNLKSERLKINEVKNKDMGF